MKKVAMVCGLGLALLAISGFGFTEVSEYFQVARKNINEGLKSNISADVELDRLEVVLQKLNLQISKHKIQVAKAEVAHDRAVESWNVEVVKSEKHMQKMADLRDIQKSMANVSTVKVGCHSVSIAEIKAALASQLELYKSCKKVCAKKAELMESQRMAVQKLKAKFNEMKQQSQLLSQKLDLLRSRNEIQKANATINGELELDDTELSRAKALVEEIETRFDINDKASELNGHAADIIIQSNGTGTAVESEVDEILGKQNANENDAT